MNKSKMSGTENGYGDDIHDLIDNVPIPNDESITLSSYENSQITLTKSMNLSKRASNRQNQRDIFKGNYGQNINNEEDLSPYRNNADKTLTIKSLNSSIQDEYEHSDRGQPHSPEINQTLSPTSSRNEDTSNFMSRNLRRNFEEDKEEFDNYRSIHYGEDTLDENTSPHRRQRLELTEESGYNNNITNTTAFVDSAMRRHSYSDESFYEGEESEYEEEEEENSRDGYFRRTDQSNEEDHSLIDHTTTQYIRNQDITSGILFKQSQSDSTIDRNQITDENFYRHQNYINSEEEEAEEERDYNDESEISGIDSLSQTNLSKMSSSKFSKNKRLNRKDHSRMTGNFAKAKNNSSQYMGTEPINKEHDGTQSIGLNGRNNRNEESLSLTPSNDSWGAITPRQADLNKRTLNSKAGRSKIGDLDSKSIKPLYIDDGLRQNYKVVSEGTDQNLTQSNLCEELDQMNSRTIERNPRHNKEVKGKKVKERNKNNSLAKAIGNLPRDNELEHALSNDLEYSNNHIIFKDNLGMRSEFVGNLDVQPLDKDMEVVSMIEYKKVKMELSQYKANCHQLQVQNHKLENERRQYIGEIDSLTSKLLEEENRANKIEDYLHASNDIKNESDKKNIQKLKDQKIHRLRDEITHLKQENYNFESEVIDLRKKLDEFKEMESYFLNEIKKKDNEITKFEVKVKAIQKQEDEITKLTKNLLYWKDNCSKIEASAHLEVEKLDNQNLKYKDIIKELERKINSLETEINDNRHLIDDDQNKNIQLYNELQVQKSKLAEVIEELELYKRSGKNHPMNSKVDFDKEIQKRDQIHSNKIQSLHQQIDEWKNKVRELEQECSSYQKQNKKLETLLASNASNNSTRLGEQSEILETVDRIKELFNIKDNDDILSELDKIREEVETINILKEELGKAEKIINKKTEENKSLLSHLESSSNTYSEHQIKLLNEDIIVLKNENSQIRHELGELEAAYESLKHENHSYISKFNERNGVIRERESEIMRLKSLQSSLEEEASTYKNACGEVIKQKKVLEQKLDEATKLDNFDKLKSNKENELMKSEVASLISFIMSLELAYDEEFANLLKNQSYINEYDQARKHLQNQKQMVELVINRYENSLKTSELELSKYKEYISQLEKSNELGEEHKSEAIKWKQNFERLAVTTKGSAGDSRELKNSSADFQILQDKYSEVSNQNKNLEFNLKEKAKTIEQLQNICKENENTIFLLEEEINKLQIECKKGLKRSGMDSEAEMLNLKNSNLILRLEKDLKRCESERDSLKLDIENQRKVMKEIQEKYDKSQAKISQMAFLEQKVKNIETENFSLVDQLTVIKKINSDQLKSLQDGPTDLIKTINSLKSALNKKESFIQELKGEKQIIQNLLDEARVEIKNSEENCSVEGEKASFGDAIEILDMIITKSCDISYSNTSNDFNSIFKRVQIIKDQTEEPIVNKITNILSHYIPQYLESKEKECKSLNDFKKVIIDACKEYKDENRVSFDEQNELLNISTDSKLMRKPYGYNEAYIDISFVFDQYSSTFEAIKSVELESSKKALAKILREEHEANMDTLSNEFYEKFEEDRKQLQEKFNLEKQTEIKLLDQKLRKEFDSKLAEKYEQFEAMKKDFKEQLLEQCKKFQSYNEDEANKQRQDIEKQKVEYEKEFEKRLQKKQSLLEGIFNTRMVELEDDFNLKKQRLEFEMKTKVETEDHKNKADLELLVSKFETQSQDKIKRIESETQVKIQDYIDQLNQKEEDIKKLKLDNEKKAKDLKKQSERELKFKSETLDKESKIKIDREAKKFKETIEDLEVKLKDSEAKLNEERKKHRELSKSNNEKHKAEIKNIKNTHENEIIRKKIEIEKDFKKVKRDLEIEIENLKKEHEVKIMEKLLEQKKELNSQNSQKLKLEKTKFEKELIEKETELTQKFNQAEIELIKRHEEEIDKIKEMLNNNHEKILNSTIENTKLEIKEQLQREFNDQLECATERVKNEYKSENTNLKIKLQEYAESQSNISQNDSRILNFDSVGREEMSIQTDDIPPISINEMQSLKAQKMLKSNTPFDYDKLRNKTSEASVINEDDEEAPKPEKSLKYASNNQEICEAIHINYQKQINSLQHRYDLRIIELIKEHKAEVQQIQLGIVKETVAKIERILILELDKMCQAVMSKSREETIEHNKSANLIIGELIKDLTNDCSTTENLERIKKKLNDVLIKYKQKVDFRVKHKMEQDFMIEKKKLQVEYARMRNELEIKAESPSMLDTGVEHGDSPEHRIRQTAPLQTKRSSQNNLNGSISDFTKEYTLCDKKIYEKNILTKVSPLETENKTIVVDLQRIVSDLNMLKNSFANSAKQLGFILIEPHKLDQDDYQEQLDPNIPEPVFNSSQNYRHLLNTFLRFSRDIVVNINGEEKKNFIKEEEEKLYKHKQEIMSYQLQISDLKEKVKKAEKELRMLQSIYQNHLDSRLQVLDFSIYDKTQMAESTKECILLITESHSKLMELQSIFLRNGRNMATINDECYEYIKREEEDSDPTFNEIDPEISYSEEKINKHKRWTLENQHRQINEFGLRKSTEIVQSNVFTAQIPRPSISGGANSKSGYTSPRFTKNTQELLHHVSTESTKDHYLYSSENVQSTAKPPKFKRDIVRAPIESVHLKSQNYLQEKIKINEPKKSLERRNSFENLQLFHSRNKAGLASTQSLKNLSQFIGNQSFRENHLTNLNI